jgi:hypothetical protein
MSYENERERAESAINHIRKSVHATNSIDQKIVELLHELESIDADSHAYIAFKHEPWSKALADFQDASYKLADEIESALEKLQVADDFKK